MSNLAIYFHVATIGNYKEVVSEILTELKKSKLLKKAKRVVFSIAGEGEVILPKAKNIKVFRHSDLEYGEYNTLKLIEGDYRDIESSDKILYLHTKGVTMPDNECVTDWRRYMLYFNVNLYKRCVESLAENDTCGVEFLTWPIEHYSGNFWWCNASYIKKLPCIKDISYPGAKTYLTLRHNAEFWIGMGGGKHFCIHHSNAFGCKRYIQRYEPHKYMEVKKDSWIKKFIKDICKNLF